MSLWHLELTRTARNLERRVAGQLRRICAAAEEHEIADSGSYARNPGNQAVKVAFAGHQETLASCCYCKKRLDIKEVLLRPSTRFESDSKELHF